MSIPTDVEYVSINTAAQLLEVSTKTVRRWISQGKLPARRIGRTIRIRRSSLARIGKTATNVSRSE